MPCPHRQSLQGKWRHRFSHYQPRLQLKVNVNFALRLLCGTYYVEGIIGPRAGLEVVNKSEFHYPAGHRTQVCPTLTVVITTRSLLLCCTVAGFPVRHYYIIKISPVKRSYNFTKLHCKLLPLLLC